MPRRPSRSKQSAAKTVFAVFEYLKKNGGSAPSNEIFEHLRKTLSFTDWEKEIYETTGYVRWESLLHFYTVDSIKAGFLVKQNGIWYLTEEGEKAMKAGPEQLVDEASKAYRLWHAENKKVKQSKATNNVNEEEDEDLEIEENPAQAQKAALIQLQEQAIAGIKSHINRQNPYEFQDIVAALLRAMKYYTPFVSPKGKDGGIDIIAFQDPLGATSPRIKVQVKHRPEAAINVNDIRSLLGLLNKDGDVGLFVTSGRFTSEAERFSRDSHIHVKLIDVDSFIKLWQDFYHNLPDEDKNLLPLQSIYFLGSND